MNERMRPLALVLGSLSAIHQRSPMQALLAYAVVSFAVFTIVWRFRGLDHVVLDPEKGHKKDWPTAMYYSIVTMTSFTPPGEIPPKSGVARAIIASQAALSYISIFWLILTPPGPGVF